MKSRVFFNSVLLICSCIVLWGCKPDKINQSLTIDTSNVADFKVENMTTGEEAFNQSIIVNGNRHNILSVHQGDVLRLTYTPSSEQAWEVTFSLFDDVLNVVEPYVMEYTVGQVSPGMYEAKCESTYGYADMHSTGETGIVYLNVASAN